MPKGLLLVDVVMLSATGLMQPMVGLTTYTYYLASIALIARWWVQNGLGVGRLCITQLDDNLTWQPRLPFGQTRRRIAVP